VSPIWNPEFFGNTIVVNGKTWPFMDVEPRRYRFRFLNGSQSRFLILQLVTASDPTAPTTWVPVTGASGRSAPIKASSRRRCSSTNS